MSTTSIEFKSKDGLLITADLYRNSIPKSKFRGFILLCHRSHCNRGEYRETAPILNKLGYECMAIDQRSGMRVFGVTNETKNRAKQKGLPTGYVDAKPDIEAAIDYTYQINDNKPIILFGSSYSASLALLLAQETDKVCAVIAFSPGEYLKGVDVAKQIALSRTPLFVTSPKKEVAQTKAIIQHMDKKNVVHFIPTVEGFHGSKTLWATVEGHETYWQALKSFLQKL